MKVHKQILSALLVATFLFSQLAHAQTVISCPVDTTDESLRIGSYNADNIGEYLVQQFTPISSVTITSVTVQCRYGPDSSGAQPLPLITSYGLSLAAFVGNAVLSPPIGSTTCFISFAGQPNTTVPCTLTLTSGSPLVAGQPYVIVIDASATSGTNLVCAGSGQVSEIAANCTGLTPLDTDRYTRNTPTEAASFVTNDIGSHTVNILAFDATFAASAVQDPHITHFNGTVELFEGADKTWYTLFEDEAARIVVRGYIMKPEYPALWGEQETWFKQISIQHLNCKVLVHVNVSETVSNCHEPEDLSAELLYTKSAFYVVEVGRHFMPKRVDGESVREHYLDVFIKPQKARNIKCIGLMC